MSELDDHQQREVQDRERQEAAAVHGYMAHHCFPGFTGGSGGGGLAPWEASSGVDGPEAGQDTGHGASGRDEGSEPAQNASPGDEATGYLRAHGMLRGGGW